MTILITIVSSGCSTRYTKNQIDQALAYIAGLVAQDIPFTVTFS